MQNQKSKGAAWQRRREEYLRAAERDGDLIKEGYVSPGAEARWSIIVGGRTGRNFRVGDETTVHLVERGTRDETRTTCLGM
jgi:hypothetical protein